MLAYRLTVNNSEVFVLLKASMPLAIAKIEYQGDEEAIAQLKEWLEGQYDPFGHLIGPTGRTSPVALAFVMEGDRARVYEPKRISGGELVQDYNPAIPPGAVT